MTNKSYSRLIYIHESSTRVYYIIERHTVNQKYTNTKSFVPIGVDETIMVHLS